MPKNKKDAQVEEFMQVMQPRTKKARTWANDDLALDASNISVTDSTMKGGDVSDAALGTNHEDEVEGILEEVDDLEWMKRRMQRGIKSVDESKAFSQDVDDDKSTERIEGASKVRDFHFFSFFP